MNFLTIRKKATENSEVDVFETWLNDDDSCVVNQELSYGEMLVVMNTQVAKMVECNIISQSEGNSIGRDWLLYDEIVERMIYS